MIVDDKLYSTVEYPRKVRESRVREEHRRKLILVADNLANYFRILLNNNPRKFREELRRFKNRSPRHSKTPEVIPQPVLRGATPR